MTSKLVVNTIEADTGISSVSFASSISMDSTSKFHFSAAGVDIGADTNINRPAAGVLGFNISGVEKVRIDTNGHIHGVGVVTATHFYGNGANLTSLPAANLTGTLPAISGANLTSLPAQITFNNAAADRVLTSNGGTAVNGESNLTFDGTEFKIGGDSGVSGTFGLEIYNTDSNEGTALIAGTQGARLDIMDTGSSERLRIAAAGAAYFISYKSGDPFIFQTTDGSGTAERLRITSDGKIGIGENNPTREFVLKNAGGNCQLSITSGTSNSAYLNLGDTDDDNIGSIYYDNSNDRIVFRANTTDIVRMESDGNIRILDGNLRIATAGHGIDFSATAGSPSNGGELLDDYEEGNFTPSLGGVSNWSSYSVTGQGHYVKIGKAVHININFGNVDLNNSASGSVIIFNLPFVPFVVNPDCRGVTSNYMAHKIQHANDGMIHSFFIHPTYGLRGQITKNNTNWTSWDASNFTATGVYLDLSVTYFTAS